VRRLCPRPLQFLSCSVSNPCSCPPILFPGVQCTCTRDLKLRATSSVLQTLLSLLLLLQERHQPPRSARLQTCNSCLVIPLVPPPAPSCACSLPSSRPLPPAHCFWGARRRVLSPKLPRAHPKKTIDRRTVLVRQS